MDRAEVKRFSAVMESRLKAMSPRPNPNSLVVHVEAGWRVDAGWQGKTYSLLATWTRFTAFSLTGNERLRGTSTAQPDNAQSLAKVA
jgi:hypothetical protein